MGLIERYLYIQWGVRVWPDWPMFWAAIVCLITTLFLAVLAWIESPAAGIIIFMIGPFWWIIMVWATLTDPDRDTHFTRKQRKKITDNWKR